MNIENLKKLARHLFHKVRQEQFEMSEYVHGVPIAESSKYTECGTVGCALGHCPYVGIPKFEHEKWWEYGLRVLGLTGKNYSWCFDGAWACYDNTPKGAARRIAFMVDKGRLDEYSTGYQYPVKLYSTYSPSWLTEEEKPQEKIVYVMREVSIDKAVKDLLIVDLSPNTIQK